VKRLLAAQGKTFPVLDSASALSSVRRVKEAAAAGQVIGSYRIVREIGRGGMGAVYLAERVDRAFEKRVAIKILRSPGATPEVIRRFQQERQILASLDHPNIARLLDGGSTSQGLPYFVMEYVEGQPITDYCNQRGLTVAARLKLFETVCSAVQTAHQKLIVHRDIKPGNILVAADGGVKLLDFGIAKLVGPSTEDTLLFTHQDVRPMTPDYASPEQIQGQPVTTATDVYQLGVVLYELLTGRRPYQDRKRALHEVARAICEEEPTRASDAAHTASVQISEAREGTPAKLSRRLKGDIDNILLKALQKEPDRRYRSVEQFAADLRNHLEGRSVSARPDTLAYRATRFVRRNKVAAGLTAAAALLLIGGFLFASWQAAIARQERFVAVAERRRADEHATRAQSRAQEAELARQESERQQREAERQRAIALIERARAEGRFQDLRQLTTSVLLDVHDEIQTIAGGTRARASLVKSALPYLDRLAQAAAHDPELAYSLAAAYLKVGDLQGRPFWPNLGKPADAVRSYQTSLRLLERSPERDNRLARQLEAQIYERLTSITPRGEQRRAYAFKALAFAEKLHAAAPGVTEHRRLLSIALRRGGAEHFAAHDFDKAEELYRRSFSLAEGLVSSPESTAEDKHHLSDITVSLGDVENARGRLADGIQKYQQGLRIIEDLLIVEPANAHFRRGMAGVLRLTANAQEQAGQPQEAVKCVARSVAILEELAALDTRNAEYRTELPDHQYTLAMLLARLARQQEAREIAAKALAGREKLLQEDPDNAFFINKLAEACNMMAQLLVSSNETAAALEMRRRALLLRERVASRPGASDTDRRQLAQDLAGVSMLSAQAGEAEASSKELGRAIRIYESLKAARPRDPDLIRATLSAHGAALSQAFAAKDWQQMLEHLRKAEATIAELGDKATVADIVSKAEIAVGGGYMCMVLENFDCAAEVLERALGLYSKGYANAPDQVFGWERRSQATTALSRVYTLKGLDGRANQVAREHLETIRGVSQRDPSSQSKRVLLANALANTGLASMRAGEYENARRHLKEAADLLNSVSPADVQERSRLAWEQAMVAALYEEIEPAAALPLAEAALQNLVSATQGSSTDQNTRQMHAEMHGVIGDVLWRVGRKDDATARYKEWRVAFKPRESVPFAPQIVEYARRLNRLGEFPNALSMLQRGKGLSKGPAQSLTYRLARADLHLEFGRAYLGLASTDSGSGSSWAQAHNNLLQARELYIELRNSGKLSPAGSNTLTGIEADIERCRPHVTAECAPVAR
jgi:tetratricopeptide (TPR) repeat protein